MVIGILLFFVTCTAVVLLFGRSTSTQEVKTVEVPTRQPVDLSPGQVVNAQFGTLKTQLLFDQIELAYGDGDATATLRVAV